MLRCAASHLDAGRTALTTTRTPLQLGFREREIFDAVHRLGRATVAEAREALKDPPTYSAVRAILNKLQRKGFIKCTPEGGRYVYRPAEPAERTLARTIGHVMRNVFGGSASRMVAALLDSTGDRMTEQDLDTLAAMIQAKRQSLRQRRTRKEQR